MLASVAGQPQLLLAVTPVLAFASTYAVQESTDDLRAPQVRSSAGYRGNARVFGLLQKGWATHAWTHHPLHKSTYSSRRPLSPAA